MQGREGWKPARSLPWLCGTVVERRSVTSELSLSYTRAAAHG